MKTIFETFKKSIYSISFYKEIPATTFLAGLRYYTKITLLFSLAMTVVIGVVSVPWGISFIKDSAPDLVREHYPKELSVHVENGVATANVEMPYFAPIKRAEISTTTALMQNLLVIDTNEEFSKSKFEEYKTYSLLTRTDIVTRDANGAITITPLPPRSTVTVNQDTILSWVENIQKYAWAIIIAGLAGTFLVVLCGYLMYLVPLLLFALVPKFIAYIKKTPLSYVDAYKMSLYAIVPALALKTLFNILGMIFLPAYFTLLIFLLIITLNMRDEEKPTLFENNNNK